jgi:hypothetical protein
MWQDDEPRPTLIHHNQRVLAGQPRNANNDHQHPLSLPRFPWYY